MRCLVVILSLVLVEAGRRHHHVTKCKMPEGWIVDGHDVMHEVRGKITLIALMELHCQFCAMQISGIRNLRMVLHQNNMFGNAFVIIAPKNESKQWVEYWRAKLEQDQISVYQDSEDFPVWKTLNGENHEFFIYDRCGRLLDSIPYNQSVMYLHYTVRSLYAAHRSEYCGPCVYDFTGRKQASSSHADRSSQPVTLDPRTPRLPLTVNPNRYRLPEWPSSSDEEVRPSGRRTAESATVEIRPLPMREGIGVETRKKDRNDDRKEPKTRDREVENERRRTEEPSRRKEPEARTGHHGQNNQILVEPAPDIYDEEEEKENGEPVEEDEERKIEKENEETVEEVEEREMEKEIEEEIEVEEGNSETVEKEESEKEIEKEVEEGNGETAEKTEEVEMEKEKNDEEGDGMEKEYEEELEKGEEKKFWDFENDESTAQIPSPTTPTSPPSTRKPKFIDGIYCEEYTEEVCYELQITKGLKAMHQCCYKGIYLTSKCVPKFCSKESYHLCCFQKFIQARFLCCKDDSLSGEQPDEFSRCCYENLVELDAEDPCCPAEVSSKYWNELSSLYEICLPNIDLNFQDMVLEAKMTDGEMEQVDLGQLEALDYQCAYVSKRSDFFYWQPPAGGNSTSALDEYADEDTSFYDSVK